MREKPWREEELLVRLHYNEALTYNAISAVIDCNKGTVGTWMQEHNIPYRENGVQLSEDQVLVDDNPTEIGHEDVTEIDFTDDRESVYVLKCRGGKYYVGETSHLGRRLRHHFAGRGALFTQVNPPEYLVEFYQCHHSERRKNKETGLTKRYMERYGPENVRGGPWAHPSLNVCPSLPAKFRDLPMGEDNSLDSLHDIVEDIYEG